MSRPRRTWSCSPTAPSCPTTSSSSPPASGCIPEETEGLTGAGWNETAFTFYTVEGATGLRDALRDFEGGHLVVNVVDMPIKCPVAPLEFAFLADWYFTDRGIRDRVDITFVTPLDGAFTKPVASEVLGGLLEEKGIRLETEFATGEVDGDGRTAEAAGTSARSATTCSSRSRCTAARRTSSAHRGSATSSGSSRPTTTRCRRGARRTSS